MSDVQQRANNEVADNAGVFTNDAYLVEALRRGDAVAFEWLIDQYHTSMVRLARLYTSSREVAEEAVQETWMGFLKGLDRYEARCSVKTWLFNILTNCAKTRGQREGRSVCFSSLSESEAQPGESAIPEELFRTEEPWRDHWVSGPRNWKETPEDCMLAGETRAFIEKAIEALPVTQRAVITLHDIDGWSPEEICNILGIMETNQRVLLHRARSRVRLALEHYLGEEQSNDGANGRDDLQRASAVGNGVPGGDSTSERPAAVRRTPDALPVLPYLYGTDARDSLLIG